MEITREDLVHETERLAEQIAELREAARKVEATHDELLRCQTDLERRIEKLEQKEVDTA